DAGFDLEEGDYLDLDNLFTVAGIDLGLNPNLYIPVCYTDNCTAVEDLKYKVIFAGQVEGDSCEMLLELRFVAEDLCGNLSDDVFTCQFIIKDNTAP
ncbi:hypothetical protein RM697_13705, partial [Ichthyenterobacterium sp. W332]